MKEQNNLSDNFQALINYCHNCAESLLINQAEFYPFGAYLDNSGELIATGYHDGDEFPLSEIVIKGLRQSFQDKMNDSKTICYAITFDTRIKNEEFPEAIDAICIQIKHVEVLGMTNYYFPYKLNGKQIDFLDSWAEHL